MGDQHQQYPAAVGEEEWFKKGAEVEVSFDEEGFRGSWYTGTVLRTVSKKSNKIFVEFQTLKADDSTKKKSKAGSSRPLREFVDAVLVRPVPPREPRRSFKLSEEVDAFHHDGWWEGIVTEVLDHSRYSLFFRSSREQLEFPESDLRLHREWVHGNSWVPPLEVEDEPPPPQQQEEQEQEEQPEEEQSPPS